MPKRVAGIGPAPCEWMFVGEGPGFHEDRAGKPFVGKTGEELDRYLNGVDLPVRGDVFLTNIFREYGGKDYVYTTADLARDEPDLLAELQRVQPKIVVSLGRYATRYFLGDVDMDAVESIPFYSPTMEGVVVFPIIHPAAGMHNPEMSPYVVKGFKQLAAYVDGLLDARQLFDDPIPNPHYEEVTSVRQLQGILRTDTAGHGRGVPTVAIDTEGWPHNPWSLQFTVHPGSGYLIRRTAADVLQAFHEYLISARPRLVFHSALHDLGMGRALQCGLESLDFDDTMVMAYLLQLEPKGLKQGALRHCNMKMMEYGEVVGDKQNELVRDYLTWIWDIEQLEWEERCEAELIRLQTTPYTDAKGKTRPGRKVTKAPQLPKTPLHKAATRVIGSRHPSKLWLDQVEDIQVAGYRRMGRVPEATLDYVRRDVSIPYGCRDTDATLRLTKEYQRRIEALGLGKVYRLELSTYPFIDRMARVGLLPDLEHFARLSGTLGQEIERLREGLEAATGQDGFNANSGDQVADYLFGTLGLDSIKQTSSGRGSTNDKILEALEHEHPEHPVISLVREYRETYKLKNTFVDRLPDFVHRWPYDGRVHSTFRTTSVVTGRLAASDPNVLAQPEHGKFAKDFKRGWVAGSGHVLCAWDESQIELRGLAHLSQDPTMLAVFRGDKRNPDGSLIDLHAATAERIFGVRPALQDKHRHRLPAKAINFGIPMGMTCRGLSVELRKNGVDADEDTAQRWLDETLGLYSGVQRYMDERIAEVRRNGYVRCLSGRIRYIGGIRSRDERVREEAGRFAFSTPIQESATYIMKQAEAIIYQDILVPYWRDNRWVEPILQVHDCIKMECEEGMEQELNTKVVQAMTQVEHGFSVPLAVEGEWGLNMADMVTF